jgi:hypothetical protein
MRVDTNNTRAQMTAAHFNRWYSVIAETGSYYHARGFVGVTIFDGRDYPVRVEAK